MELELCKETYSCYEALPPLVETREQSTETIVPDYCPDIARIVEGSGCLFVRSREIADGRVSVSGSRAFRTRFPSRRRWTDGCARAAPRRA